MPNFFWIPGSDGNWQTPANWSNTSGGTPQASLPSSVDPVFFDVNSGSGAVTISSTLRPCLSFNTTGFTGSFNGSGSVLASGSVTLGNNFNLAVSMVANSNVNLTCNGYFFTNNLVISANGNFYCNLMDNLLVSGSLSLGVNVNVVTNNYNITVGGNFNATGSSPRYMTLGSSIFTINGNISIPSLGPFNLDAGTSVVKVSGSSINIVRPLTFYELQINGSTAVSLTGTSALAFTNLKINKNVAFRSSIPTYTINGSLEIHNAAVTAITAGTRASLIVNCPTTGDNFSLKDINKTGTGSGDLTGLTNVTDGGNNIGWTFPTATATNNAIFFGSEF